MPSLLSKVATSIAFYGNLFEIILVVCLETSLDPAVVLLLVERGRRRGTRHGGGKVGIGSFRLFLDFVFVL
jgi:hypothetical protein